MMRLWAVLASVMMLGWGSASAQTEKSDSIVQAIDSLYNQLMTDSARVDVGLDTLNEVPFLSEQTVLPAREARDWDTWRPDPQKALWLALVIPGGGQIYNRKYWKLPIVYGGFLGCVYAMRWNNMMYKDYAQAYLDLMDDDPGTASYNQFLHLGRQITPANEERYKTLFKKRKDKYRRWRDLSFFVMVGVYAISVVDAYVDAELSEFDISKDLSMKVRPTVMGNGSSANPIHAASLGVNCSINF
ncbi:MAG: hypothetical protein IJ544_04235 [Prevotella sp.]|nr:hypothetical protein [Prevotella sp.]